MTAVAPRPARGARGRRGAALGLALALLAPPALADRALLIGADASSDLAQALRDAGFRTVAVPASRVAAMRTALSDFVAATPDGERRLLYLAGDWATDGRGSWLLQTAGAGRPDRATVAGVGLGLDTALAIAARAPGAALVAIGTPDDRAAGRLGTGLSAGVTVPEALPQGVTVLHGPESAVAAALSGPALAPGTPLAEAAEGAGGVGLAGFLPPGFALRPAPADPSARAPSAEETADASDAPEPAEPDPLEQARRAEQALGLDREDRRRIQSQLTVLGHEPRGVDGIFGPGSRGAIARFQRANDFEDTSYLTRPQIEELGVQAARRQAELEAEAERRRLAAEREDRAVWEATGAEGDEAGLRTYLDRYPDGLFAEEARARLAGIEAERRAEAGGADAAAWERARRVDTAEAYRRYLRERPDGAFAREAEARIDALERQEEEAGTVAAAREAERALGLNDITRLLVEQRLAQLGLDPGRADGSFDGATRRAIRNFQRARDLPPTGFLTQQTVARMLADLGGLIRQ